MRITLILVAILVVSPALAETVYVKYRGPVDITKFECSYTESSVVNRVCYDKKNQYMVIDLNGTYYHYCRMGEHVYKALINSPSHGKFFNYAIKGNYDCRLGGIPD